ncbi:MAG: TonB-dependent receptor [Bryobacteraceae bacterium]|nr:TonB-dependent receptor [Bryobacteraceae bacterium]MDW8378248.1 carboxypeptidase regulatory-like domain-containing protein [Bryobacterales bacterium]
MRSLLRSLLVFVPFLLFLLAAKSAHSQEKGIIIGQVFDGQTARPIIGVKISVNGQSSDLVSGNDGRFQLSLSPGKYTLKFTAENYADTEVKDVEVKAGEVTDASTVMSNKALVTTVEVVEKIGAVGASAEAMLTERKLAAVVSDGMSKEELSGSTASNAAAALEKVTGVSVVDNGYVYVRGLGERYSATMLNSAMIPTTEPEKRVVPLDLFPAELIDNIKILKTYTPDMPGEFAGGLVQMQTVEFPTSKIFRVSTSVGFNSRTTFNRFLTYPGGRFDYFGFDDGTRAIPSAIPREARLFPGTFNAQQLQQFGRAFPVNWEPTVVQSQRPQQSFSMVGGGTFGRFGLVGAVTFANRPQYQQEINRYLRQEGARPVVFTNYEDFRAYNEAARLGAVFNVATRLNAANKLVFRNTLTHDSDKEAREFQGFDGGNDGVLQSQRLRWIERGLFSTSVEGDHALAKFGNSVLKWQFTYSRSDRNEPDLREVFRGPLPNGQFAFLSLGSSGLRFFNDLQDRIYEPQIDFSRPFVRGIVSGLWKIGFRGTFRERDFQARRFRFIPQRLTVPLTAPSNVLFSSANIRPDGFQIVEFTRATDRYDATMDIYAGYAMVDLALGMKWRIVGGLRIEDADIEVRTLDPLVPSAAVQRASLVNRDPMPGVNVIYALSPRQNLRLSFSQTVSRPDFRELSPFDFNNVLGGFVAQGNPNLLRAKLLNFDARWEAFLGGNQVLAASFFFKDFTNPIEVSIIAAASDLRQTYVNAEGAFNTGFELEARKNLSFLNPKLRQFAVQGNFTFVDSNIRLREDQARLLTSEKRPLVGQSRYIFNIITEWLKPEWRSTSRFYVNSVSRRLTDVGTFGLPDIYQDRNVFLDFVYQLSLTETGKWQLRFNGENLGDNRYQWTQGPFVQRQFRLGRTFSLGLSYSVF